MPRKRGARVAGIVDPFRFRQIWCDSGLEEDHIHVLIANPRVREIREQQVASFVDRGHRRKHFFDVVVGWEDGVRHANAVKYADDVTAKLERDLRLVCEQHGARFAHEFRILTEKDITRTQIANARQVVACGSDFDFEGQRLVREVLSDLPSTVSFEEIAVWSGLGRRGFRAAVALVQSGCLVLPKGMLIGWRTEVTNKQCERLR